MKLKNFSLQGTNDLNFELNKFSGKKLVIYFYPKDSTPGCTNEGIDFSTKLAEFKAKNCEVFGVSRDSLKSNENFKKKYNNKESVPRPSHWSGWNLKPSSIEFWLDGDNRIHERLKYNLDKNDIWTKSLLSP